MTTESIAPRLQDLLGAAAVPAAPRDRAGPFKAAYKGQMESSLRWLDARRAKRRRWASACAPAHRPSASFADD